MSYVIFDTETTGLPDFNRPAHAEGQPRLASWCMIFVDEALHIEFINSALVKPDGWTMPDEVAAINGLTTQRLIDEGSSIRWPLALLRLAIDAGRTLVAHNLSFDAKIMRGELRRAGYPDYYAEQTRHHHICTMATLTPVCGIPHPSRPGQYRWPKLAVAHELLLGEKLVGAHDAIHDAMGCYRLFKLIKERGLEPLSEAA